MRSFHVAWNSPTGNAHADAVVYRAALRGFRLPAWVPARLAAEYCDCAMAHGPDRATAFIERRMSELAAMERA